MVSVDETINQRQKTYGDFSDLSRIAQTTKLAWRSERGWNKLSYVQREALESIAVKVARILSGDPKYKDTWHDIAGYALLGQESDD